MSSGLTAVLDVSVAALRSLLQRARTRLEQQTVDDEQLAEPSDERARLILDRYVAAFEQSDMAAIERLLADDAVLQMTGTTTWFSARRHVSRSSPTRPSACPATG
jgi:RNA polymerase sigma-70 factor (ECF subfamily)